MIHRCQNCGAPALTSITLEAPPEVLIIWSCPGCLPGLRQVIAELLFGDRAS